MSSARKAWSSMVVIDGMSSTVDASTPRPTFAPSMRSHTGVKRLEYSGKRIVREASISRSVVHACHPTRLRTGCRPSCSPIASSRTETTTSPANTTPATSVAGTSQARALRAASARLDEPAMPMAMRAPPVANATIGSRARKSDDRP